MFTPLPFQVVLVTGTLRGSTTTICALGIGLRYRLPLFYTVLSQCSYELSATSPLVSVPTG